MIDLKAVCLYSCLVRGICVCVGVGTSKRQASGCSFHFCPVEPQGYLGPASTI